MCKDCYYYISKQLSKCNTVQATDVPSPPHCTCNERLATRNILFNCTFLCHAHLYGIVLLYFVVACVRGLIHNIVITLFFIIDGIISLTLTNS